MPDYRGTEGFATLSRQPHSHTERHGQTQGKHLVDDLLATGGTAEAGCKLVESLGAAVSACAFVVELDALGGRERLAGRRVHSLIHD